MPVSVVVGGQFGSEGKGKVAHRIACDQRAAAVVRVGGTNSGHTAVHDGQTWALRQLPVSVLAPGTVAILPAGALIDVDIFLKEVRDLGLGPERVVVSADASVISDEDKAAERHAGLIQKIGSTGSGTGAALIRRISRQSSPPILASTHPALAPFIKKDPTHLMREMLNRKSWIVIEGSQGFGLSVLHGGYYPKATSRDTTAGTFVGEAGLSPLDINDVTLVIRAHPIRVAGDSGPLPGETTWKEIAANADLPPGYAELTTATKKIRRVGTFDPALVQRAVSANNPTRLVLNHFDYIDSEVRRGHFTETAKSFLVRIENSISRRINWIGIDPASFLSREEVFNERSVRQGLNKSA